MHLALFKSFNALLRIYGHVCFNTESTLGGYHHKRTMLQCPFVQENWG